MTNKKIVFWSPVDPIVKFCLENNPSLPIVAERFPHIFVCSNGIDQEVYKRVGHNAIIVETENDMKIKGTAAFEKIREMDFDICIRLDVDSIVFDLDKLIELASRTGPKQLLGWKRKLKRRIYVRGGCHAVGRYIIDNIAPLGSGSSFDKAMNKRTIAIGGELVDVRLFELNKRYTGRSPVWHPPKGKKGIMTLHTKFYDLGQKPITESEIRKCGELWKSVHAEPSV